MLLWIPLVTTPNKSNGTLILGIFQSPRQAFEQYWLYLVSHKCFASWWRNASMEYPCVSLELIKWHLHKTTLKNNDDELPCDTVINKNVIGTLSAFINQYEEMFGFAIENIEPGKLFPFYNWSWNFKGYKQSVFFHKFLECLIDGDTMLLDAQHVALKYPIKGL